ncbi:hypothetical protein KGQ27_02780 [Patescibacteria group bacterium]|nr:hypothetical protein [Patescibacteria group bacterium]MDE1946793.1 hypothetical protein [Patescibacteria group bacterium]MDE2011075.1 hypothetical protein [Patescibacteria group bacterium]MDE2233132.1 hypothetical protein [Patescibacteria group bacterium]
MSKRQWLIIFGVIVVALPFLGFPLNWNAAFSVALGLLIIIVAYRIAPTTEAMATNSEDLPYAEHHSDIATKTIPKQANIPEESITSDSQSNQ